MTRRTFSRIPITLRVALAMGGLMILLGLVASQQVLRSLSRLHDDRLREIARLHVGGLSVALGPLALHKDVWEIYDTLDRARTASDGQRMLFTVVADDRNRVLAASDPLRAPIDSDATRFSEDASDLAALTASGGAPQVRVRAPLLVAGRRVGQIVTEIDVGDLVAERRRVSLFLLLANAAATVLLACAGYVLVARMLKPVTLLTQHMDSAGGAPGRIPEAEIPESDTELARLLRRFNTMTGAIEARTEAERRLAERERFVSLGRLSSSLAHEINNPLGGLLNTADTIRTYAGRPEVVQSSAELLQRGLLHLKDVSRAILEENRLDRSGTPLRPSDFDDLKLLFEPEATRKAQSLDWTIRADGAALATLPAAPLRQIVLNLLLNASAAAPEGGRIGLDVTAQEDAIELAITDDGPGLGARDLDRLMSSVPVAPGGGVGLRLVHDLVAGLGGRIRHHREAGRTALVVRLPSGRA
ncbi:MAG: HAMP domain-containing sensor histidine kinase [Antarcticimicrobium sp.]|uniref:sensor histidine kinase n=1 Tax=Antarcticimicrobium sp. TaxID=2824147 RepID=UPI00260DEE47|nr:HAMP domain-containing sensor histidine kinase [Antarcticimicrobium sp.]MDF1717396.1 HAMP domain-containing sensor histidine kinase [Antarcticimicrobium sp.]